MPSLSAITPTCDRWAVSASVVCAVHCLSLPLLLGVFPALSTSILGQEAFHQVLLWLIIPLSLFSLTLGCKRHKTLSVAMWGVLGIAVLTFTAVLGHDLLGEFYERVGTLIGASAIAVAHIKNYRMCRKAKCRH